jgi:hypothetical protein
VSESDDDYICVWGDSDNELLAHGFDIKNWIDPIGNSVTFLTLYKARSALYAQRPEQLSNADTVKRVKRLVRGNRRCTSESAWERACQDFIHYDCFMY